MGMLFSRRRIGKAGLTTLADVSAEKPKVTVSPKKDDIVTGEVSPKAETPVSSEFNYSRSEITLMKSAEIQEIANKLGIDTDGLSVVKVRKLVTDKLGL